MKTYQGGCHCGAVRYEVDTELAQVIACNCSHCHAKGLVLTFVTPDAFRLTEGDDSIQTEYLFNKKRIRHLFCPTCGVQSYSRGQKPDGTEMVAINVRCLEGVDLDTLTLTPVDGKQY